jgi:hypothetical protein
LIIEADRLRRALAAVTIARRRRRRHSVTKTRQRERRKRRQAEMQAGADVSTVKDERATNEAIVKIVDVLFRDMAEKAAAENDISIEDAIEGSWTLFEAGFLQLFAGDNDRVGIEPCREARAEQRAQAKRNRPLVELRRRLLAETEGRPVG